MITDSSAATKSRLLEKSITPSCSSVSPLVGSKLANGSACVLSSVSVSDSLSLSVSTSISVSTSALVFSSAACVVVSIVSSGPGSRLLLTPRYSRRTDRPRQKEWFSLPLRRSLLRSLQSRWPALS